MKTGNKAQGIRDHKPALMLLFTRGISLGIWDRVGMLDREVELYRRLSPHLSGISFLTYGDIGEQAYKERLGDIDIVSNERRLKPTRFSVLAPFLLRSRFRSADVIKTNQMDGAWTAVIAKILYGKKITVRCGYLWSEFQRNRLGAGLEARLAFLLEKACLKAADVCIVATRRDKEYIENAHGISGDKVRIVPNYVNTDLFRPMAEVERERGLLCFVGRLVPQKNLEALFEACHGLENVRLLLIGDGELRDGLRRKADELGLSVEFLPSVPNNKLPEYLNRAQAFVLPSHYEGCPKALLEAMACETPVIGTNVKGIADIISHGENGVLSDKSPDSIRRAIIDVLNDAASAERTAKQARQYVIEHHSLENIVRQELEIIRFCASRR